MNSGISQYIHVRLGFNFYGVIDASAGIIKFLWRWYFPPLGFLQANNIRPIFDFYEPTITDFIIAAVIAVTSALVVCWIMVCLLRLLLRTKASPAIKYVSLGYTPVIKA